MAEITLLTADLFTAEVKTARISAVVAFTAGWTDACRELESHMAALAGLHPGYRFFKVDIDDAEPLAAKHEVAGIPTALVFREGEERDRLTGRAAMSRLPELLQKKS
ncbi:MAG: thioredoxin family protein [Planctomycetota bacterium]